MTIQRVSWTPDMKARVAAMRRQGLTAAAIADELRVPVMAVQNIIIRAGMPKLTEIPGYIDENLSIPVFRGDFKLPMDDYIVLCDHHSPYYSTLWHNRSLAIAARFGIRKVILVGDLVDFAFASHYYSDNKPGLDDEKAENERLIQSLLAAFDEVYHIKGNHEDRLGRQTDGVVQARVLLEMWTGKDAWQKRWHYSLYDKLTIGDEWLLVHPKSYSIISTKVAKTLAAKYHKNILNTHGHFLGYGYDISGRFYAADIGGIFDKDKIEYKNIKTTTHPEWKNGFAMLKNGRPYLFDDNTDWSFWLDGFDVAGDGEAGGFHAED